MNRYSRILIVLLLNVSGVYTMERHNDGKAIIPSSSVIREKNDEEYPAIDSSWYEQLRKDHVGMRIQERDIHWVVEDVERVQLCLGNIACGGVMMGILLALTFCR